MLTAAFKAGRDRAVSDMSVPQATGGDKTTLQPWMCQTANQTYNTKSRTIGTFRQDDIKNQRPSIQQRSEYQIIFSLSPEFGIFIYFWSQNGWRSQNGADNLDWQTGHFIKVT